MELEAYVKEAILGNKKALEELIKAIQDDIYYLSLRMLANPEDAKDATQEIVIRVITKLSMFKFQSHFKTWVYRLASNYLISYKKETVKKQELTFEIFKEDLESDLRDNFRLENDVEYHTMLDELRISCTMAMLLCLSPSLRMAFILGEVFELEHQEASEVLEISKDAYRKQLSRARSKLTDFMQESCGLVSDSAKCSCECKLHGALNRGRIHRENICFSQNGEYSKMQKTLKGTQEELKVIKAQCGIMHYSSPSKLEEVLLELVE